MAITSSPGARSARRAQRRSGQVVGNMGGLEHREIVLRAHADHRRFRLETVVEAHFDALGPGDYVQVREDDAGIDNHDAGSDAFHRMPVLFLLASEAAHAHHRFADRLVGLRRLRGQRLGFKRVQHRGVDVVLRERARRRPERRIEEDRRERARGGGCDEQERRPVVVQRAPPFALPVRLLPASASASRRGPRRAASGCRARASPHGRGRLRQYFFAGARRGGGSTLADGGLEPASPVDTSGFAIVGMPATIGVDRQRAGCARAGQERDRCAVVGLDEQQVLAARAHRVAHHRAALAMSTGGCVPR